MGLLSAQDATNFNTARSRGLFGYAREAVIRDGGNISTLRTLRFVGQSRVEAAGGTLVEAEIDVRILLPAYYLRIDRIGAVERRVGFAGNVLLNEIRQGGSRKVPGASQISTMRSDQRARLGWFMLGTLTYVSAEMPLTFQPANSTMGMRNPRAGPAMPAPLDTVSADSFALDAMADADLWCRFAVSPSTYLPLQIDYMAPKRAVATMIFDDRRSVAGFKIPYKITTTINDRVVDEMVFKDVRVNPPLTKSDFES